MFILTYSREIWYIVLSIGFLALISFLCSLLYQLILAAKDIREAAEGVKNQIDEVNKIIEGIKKINVFKTYGFLAGSILKKAKQWISQENFGKAAARAGREKARKNRPTGAKHEKNAAGEPEMAEFMQEEL